MQNVDEMIIKTEFVEMAQQKARENSLKTRKNRVYGESYVSKDPNRLAKIEDAKKVILTVAAIATIGVLTSVGSTLNFVDNVKEEINSTHVATEAIGGGYKTVNDYDEAFVEYANGLNAFELNKLYNQTEKSMDFEDGDSIEEVVAEMEQNFLEGNKKGK